MLSPFFPVAYTSLYTFLSPENSEQMLLSQLGAESPASVEQKTMNEWMLPPCSFPLLARPPPTSAMLVFLCAVQVAE